jgi:hypothetical protein
VKIVEKIKQFSVAKETEEHKTEPAGRKKKK